MISEFAKEKVFWTRKMNLKLVKFIESKPNIWHPKHPKYTSVAYRDKTYAEFAAKYGNEFTGQAVRDRWTNIRSTFTYYLRKSKASLIKPEGEMYKVKWHLWDACGFLLNVTKPNITIPTISSDWQEDELKANIEEEEEISNEEYNHAPTEISNVNSDVTCQNIANGILNVLKNVQNDVLNVDNSKHGQFGQTLMDKLANMSSLEASQISCKIMEILWLYHEDNPLNPNGVKSEDT